MSLIETVLPPNALPRFETLWQMLVEESSKSLIFLSENKGEFFFSYLDQSSSDVSVRKYDVKIETLSEKLKLMTLSFQDGLAPTALKSEFRVLLIPKGATPPSQYSLTLNEKIDIQNRFAEIFSDLSVGYNFKLINISTPTGRKFFKFTISPAALYLAINRTVRPASSVPEWNMLINRVPGARDVHRNIPKLSVTIQNIYYENEVLLPSGQLFYKTAIRIEQEDVSLNKIMTIHHITEGTPRPTIYTIQLTPKSGYIN